MTRETDGDAVHVREEEKQHGLSNVPLEQTNVLYPVSQKRLQPCNDVTRVEDDIRGGNKIGTDDQSRLETHIEETIIQRAVGGIECRGNGKIWLEMDKE